MFSRTQRASRSAVPTEQFGEHRKFSLSPCLSPMVLCFHSINHQRNQIQMNTLTFLLPGQSSIWMILLRGCKRPPRIETFGSQLLFTGTTDNTLILLTYLTLATATAMASTFLYGLYSNRIINASKFL